MTALVIVSILFFAYFIWVRVLSWIDNKRTRHRLDVLEKKIKELDAAGTAKDSMATIEALSLLVASIKMHPGFTANPNSPEADPKCLEWSRNVTSLLSKAPQRKVVKGKNRFKK